MYEAHTLILQITPTMSKTTVYFEMIPILVKQQQT